MALDGIAVIVNADSKVEDLTVEQIARCSPARSPTGLSWAETRRHCLHRPRGGSGTRDGFESITGTEAPVSSPRS